MALRQQPYYRGKNDYRKYREERVGSVYKKDPLSEANQNIPQDNFLSNKIASYRNQTSGLKYDNFSKQLENKYSYRNGEKKFDFSQNFDLMKERPNKYSRQTYDNSQLTSARNQKPIQNAKTSKYDHQELFSQRSKFIPTQRDNNYENQQNFQQRILNRQNYNERLGDKFTFQKSTQYPKNQRIPQDFSTFVKNRNPLGFQSRQISTKPTKERNFTFMDQNKMTFQSSGFQNEEPQQNVSMRYQSRNEAIKKNLINPQRNYQNQQECFQNALIQKQNRQAYISERKQSNYIANEKLQQLNSANVNNRQNLYNRYNKTSQNTPSKLSSGAYDRGSEQRRKSLIQKSQILKQKLNKLNSSNLKPQQTDRQFSQNVPDRYTKSKELFNPTPQKKSYQNYQSSRSPYSAVSKKLQYNMPVSLYQKPSSLIDPTSYEPIQGNGIINDPIKKISQLNDKINERIQSIMRNYGN